MPGRAGSTASLRNSARRSCCSPGPYRERARRSTGRPPWRRSRRPEPRPMRSRCGHTGMHRPRRMRAGGGIRSPNVIRSARRPRLPRPLAASPCSTRAGGRKSSTPFPLWWLVTPAFPARCGRPSPCLAVSQRVRTCRRPSSYGRFALWCRSPDIGRRRCGRAATPSGGPGSPTWSGIDSVSHWKRPAGSRRPCGSFGGGSSRRCRGQRILARSGRSVTGFANATRRRPPRPAPSSGCS